MIKPIVLSFLCMAISDGLSAETMTGEDTSPNKTLETKSTINSCEKEMSALDIKKAPFQASAFKLFNDYPPSDTTYIDFIDTDIHLKAAIKFPFICLPPPPFKFTVHENGTARESRETDFIPIDIWKTSEGYRAIYLYKSEQKFDSGADSIILTLIQYNKLREIDFYIKELSSWYEYEDAVRIRNAKMTNGKIFKTEVIYNRKYLSDEGQTFSFYVGTPKQEIPMTIETQRN
jgi:hypothetical protein